MSGIEEGMKNDQRLDLMLKCWPKREIMNDGAEKMEAITDQKAYTTLLTMVKEKGFPEGIGMVVATNKDDVMRWVKEEHKKAWEESDTMSLEKMHGLAKEIVQPKHKKDGEDIVQSGAATKTVSLSFHYETTLVH